MQPTNLPAPRGVTGEMSPEFFGQMMGGLIKSFVETGLDDLIKGGQAHILNSREPSEGPESVFIDPWQILGYQGTREKQTILTFGMLREMARACKPVAAIIRTRQNQVARFCRLPRFRGDVGFSIHMRDKDAKAGPAAKKRMKEIENFLFQMGAAPAVDPNGLGRRPDLQRAVRMLTRDTLTLDAIAIEPRYNLKGELFDLWPIDAATVRYAGKDYTTQDRDRTIGDSVAYVQEYMGEIRTEYGADELIYEIRNPRTDIIANGYGESELEILIETVTSLLNADAYNSRYFTQNSLPEGILSIVGNLSQANLDAFKASWRAQVAGVANAWKVPIVATPDGKGVNFTPFKLSNRDMQFSEYNNLLIMIACAIYQIDPVEIGFNIQIGGGSSLNQASNEPTIQHSQSKGFYPLMSFLESVINSHIVFKLDDEFMFAWEGLEPDREQVLWTQCKEQLQAGVMTPRMYWNMMDIEDPYPDMVWPDSPTNPTLATVYQQESGLMGGGDDEGDEGDDEDPQDGDPQADGEDAAGEEE